MRPQRHRTPTVRAYGARRNPISTIGTTNKSLARFTVLALTVAVLIPLNPPSAAAVPAFGDVVDVGGEALEIELDTNLGLAYVTVADEQSITVVDVSNGSVTQTIDLTDEALGLSLNDSGTLLYVALRWTGSVAEVNTSTGTTVRTFDLEDTLGDHRTYDLRVVGDDLFVTASPGSLAFAWVTKLDLVTEDSVRVASDRIIRGRPSIEWGGGDSLYVSEDFSPNSLHRLDLTDPAAPIVAEDAHGTVNGTREAILAGNGSRIITSRGQEIDALTIDVLGTVPEGIPASASGGAVVALAQLKTDDSLRIRRYHLDKDKVVKTYATSCNMRDGVINDFKAMPGNEVFLASGRDGICIVDVNAEFPLCDGLAPTIVGTSGPETLKGTPDADVILGLGGDDTIEGLAGDDHLCGGDGRDTILPGPGEDRAFGNKGADTISYVDSPVGVNIDLEAGTFDADGSDEAFSFRNIVGSPHDDVLRGDDSANRIDGEKGKDLLVGRGGNDWLVGAGGKDTIRGNKGNDRLKGAFGDDLLDGGPGDDNINGHDGTDVVTYLDAPGPVIVNVHNATATGYGQDKILSIEVVQGSMYDDDLTGGVNGTLLIGEGGNDILRGMDGPDTLDGSAGDDLLLGGGGDDLLLGFTGNDELQGGPGRDILAGEAGNDILKGGSGDDAATFELSPSGVVVDLQQGTASGNGNDQLISIRDVAGSNFNDTITGDASNNLLIGLDGNDDISAKGGNDDLDGGDGTDGLNGGTGYDWCFAGESNSKCEVVADLIASSAYDARGVRIGHRMRF